MSFNSLQFCVFFPLVCIGYFLLVPIIRKQELLLRVQNVYLLGASYYFYMSWNAKYALLLLISTAFTYLSGLFIAKFRNAEKLKLTKWTVFVCFALNLGILFVFKYVNFFAGSLNKAVALLGCTGRIPAFDIVLPVGISFYTFQALSYTMDVYNGDVAVEKNFVRYALFVSFFPQLVAGPIERSKNLLKQVNRTHRFRFDNMRTGLLRMGWGFFQKMVISDSIAIFVTEIYDHYQKYSGSMILLATILFAFQIYCDFGGYSNIARGAATIMGFSLMENFHQPYFATSVGDFWRRWHISLSTWFRDYLYIPLGGNRKGRLRKYANTMIVFLTSGLWHGANWTYVIWGGLNGLFQVAGDFCKQLWAKHKPAAEKNQHSAMKRLLRMLVTFGLVDFSWLFFRASSFSSAVNMMKRLLFSFQPARLIDGSVFHAGLSKYQFISLGIALIILLIVDIIQERGHQVIESVFHRSLPVRWLLYLGLIWYILIFGVYGPNYDASQFIYFQF